MSSSRKGAAGAGHQSIHGFAGFQTHGASGSGGGAGGAGDGGGAKKPGGAVGGVGVGAGVTCEVCLFYLKQGWYHTSPTLSECKKAKKYYTGRAHHLGQGKGCSSLVGKVFRSGGKGAPAAKETTPSGVKTKQTARVPNPFQLAAGQSASFPAAQLAASSALVPSPESDLKKRLRSASLSPSPAATAQAQAEAGSSSSVASPSVVVRASPRRNVPTGPWQAGSGSSTFAQAPALPEASPPSAPPPPAASDAPSSPAKYWSLFHKKSPLEAVDLAVDKDAGVIAEGNRLYNPESKQAVAADPNKLYDLNVPLQGQVGTPQIITALRVKLFDQLAECVERNPYDSKSCFLKGTYSFPLQPQLAMTHTSRLPSFTDMLFSGMSVTVADYSMAYGLDPLCVEYEAPGSSQS